MAPLSRIVLGVADSEVFGATWKTIGVGSLLGLKAVLCSKALKRLCTQPLKNLSGWKSMPFNPFFRGVLSFYGTTGQSPHSCRHDNNVYFKIDF